MSEKPESDEFEEEDAEDVAPGGDDVESQRRRAPKGAEPAWRRLERVMEERRTAELMSDFDDYEIGDRHDDGAAESAELDDPDAPAHSEKTRKKKKSR